MRFRHARCDRAYAHFGHQLHGDASLGVDVFQIVDQLRKILDRIDVMMRWGRDQSDTGDRVPQPRDHLIDFVAGKLAALARFRTLRHLDL